nr:hypothetical protein [Tanacetum cinerariifolium]
MTSLTSMCEMACQIIQKKQEEKRIEEKQAANARYWKILACCDDDDDYNPAIIPNEPIDSLLDKFAGELTLLKPISPGIDKTDCYPENEIRLTKRLLYDNSYPRLPEEFVSKNSNANIESFFPSPIPDEDSDSHMEEIDLSFNPDDPMSSGIEKDDYDSERDILILEELLDSYSLSFPVIESYHFNISLFSRPPAKPPNGNTEILNIKMMGDVSNQKVPIPGLTFTHVSDQEKSPDLLSHHDDSWKEHSYPGCSSFPFLPP